MAIDFINIVIFFATAFLCALMYIKWKYRFWERKGVPYLKPSFPMGNLEQPFAINKGFPQIAAEIYQEFKNKGYKYAGIFASLRPLLIIVDLDLAKNILIKDFQHFTDRGLYYNEKDDPISAHVAALGGEKWRQIRHKLTPIFTSGKMKAMFQLVLNCGAELEREIDKLCKKENPVNIKELAALFTTNVIATCGLGLDCNSFEEPDNEFRVQTKKFFNRSLFDVLRFYISQSYPTLCKQLGVRAVPRSLSKFYMDVMKDIINHRTRNNVKRDDFIDLLLEINKNAKTMEDSLTFEEMSAQAFIFFLAGFDASSSTMTFAFYEVAQQQRIQDRVRKEIRSVLAKHDGKITYDSIAEMTYLGQVLDETLRKYPIGGLVGRDCTKDYNVPGEELVLEKGVRIIVSLKGIHHDPEYYPDPEKFDPERFTPENKANYHSCAYIPFGEGPRACIGMRFGVMQAKVGMVVMLKDYKYTLNANTPEMQLDGKAFQLAPLGDVLLDIERIY